METAKTVEILEQLFELSLLEQALKMESDGEQNND